MDTKPAPLTFHSKSLDRVIAMDELDKLTSSELYRFNGELVMAARSMENALSDALQQEIRTGQPVDPDWVHKVRKKMGICNAFRTNAMQLLKVPQKREIVEIRKAAPEPDDQLVTQLAEEKLEQLLIDELGERLFKELQEEAVELALEDLRLKTQAS
jgi:predicted restriction endonuclease